MTAHWRPATKTAAGIEAGRPPLSVIIRPLTAGDIPAARRLIVSVACEVYAWGVPVDEMARRFDARGELRDVDDALAHYFGRRGLFLVAVDGDQLVGTAGVRQIDAEVCELKRMWLLKEYRGRKLGHTLVRQLQAFAREAGYRAMRLTTDLKVQQPAIAFYRRLGFREVAVIPEKNDVIMEQAL